MSLYNFVHSVKIYQFFSDVNFYSLSLVRKRSRVQSSSWAPVNLQISQLHTRSHRSAHAHRHIIKTHSFSRGKIRAFVQNLYKKIISAAADLDARPAFQNTGLLSQFIEQSTKNISQKSKKGFYEFRQT